MVPNERALLIKTLNFKPQTGITSTKDKTLFQLREAIKFSSMLEI